MTPVLILTRPAAQAQAFADQIAARWAGSVRIILSPLMQIVPLQIDQDLAGAGGVIFTSAHGVAAAEHTNLCKGLPAWCVGEKTAQLAAAAGFDAIAGPGDAARLVEKISARRPAGPLVHLRGRHTRGAVADKLAQIGISCADVVAYDQHALPLTEPAFDALHGLLPVILPLFSPRTAAMLSEQGPFSAPVQLVVISTAVQGAATAIRAKSVSVAATPDAEAMIVATLKRLGTAADRMV